MERNEKRYLEKLISNYQDKEMTKVDELKALDKKVKNPVKIFSYIFGSISSLVLGFGMCVAMEVILAGLMWVGIIVGLIGILFVSINYPIYKKLLNSRKRKYANEIIELSNNLLNEDNATMVA